MKLSLTIKESDAQIQRKIMTAIRDEMNQSFDKIMPRLDKEIRARTRQYYTLNSPHWTALSYGPLDAHFGLQPGEGIGVANRIVDVVINNMEITKTKFRIFGGTGFKGGLRISIVKKNLEDVLSVGGTSVVTEKGTVLPWLDWMLLQGNRFIIQDFDIKFGSFPTSRSGSAVMVAGTGWRVPPDFQGTKEDNWLTKAIVDAQNSWLDAIIKAIQNNLNKVFK